VTPRIDKREGGGAREGEKTLPSQKQRTEAETDHVAANYANTSERMEMEQERPEDSGHSQTTPGSESETGRPAGVERVASPVNNGE